MRLLTTAALALALSPAIASAHPVHGSPPGNPFRIIDRPDPHNVFGVDLAVGGIVGDDAPEELIAFQLGIHARVALSPGFGLMAALPIAGFDTTGDPDQDDLALGALDLGGYFFTPLGGDYRNMLIFRASVTAPTASDDGVFTNLIGSEVGRLTDVLLAFPDLIGVRTALSLVHESDGLIVRFDAGLDIPLASTNDEVDIDHDPLIRLNAGAALGSGTSRLVLELTNLANSDNLDDSGDFVHQAAVGVTLNQGKLVYGFSVTVLLDSVFEDDIDGAIMGVMGTLSNAF